MVRSSISRGMVRGIYAWRLGLRVEAKMGELRG
jgi:hypothetical protein